MSRTKRTARRGTGVMAAFWLLATLAVSHVNSPPTALSAPIKPTDITKGPTTAPAVQTGVILAPGCAACSEKANLDKHKKEEARLRDLLERNKKVLDKTPKGESVYQKLASNVLTLNIMIDTVMIKINDIFSRCPGCKGGA